MSLTNQGTISSDNFFLGFWSKVTFIEDPLLLATCFLLGSIQEGVLEISREDVEHLSTLFPRTVDFISPAQVGMSFTGQMEELHRNNLRLALGQLPTTTSNYIYPAADCTAEGQNGRLVLERIRCQDDFVMVVVFWKTSGSGAVSIGGDAAVINTPVEFNALDDNQGDFGGSPEVPLGYIYAPPAAASTAC